MATLDDLRNKVRSQTETTASELTNPTIDGWLQEAYNRTMAAEAMWPFFEHTWEPQQAVGEAAIPEPVDLQEVISLVDVDNSYRLEMMDHEQAEDMFLGSLTSVGYPVMFSRWNGEMVLWPQITYEEIKVYKLRGYRTPSDWIALGAAAEPDCDSRLHWALANFAISLAYAQQEDMELERNYMDRWQRDVEIARKLIMGPDMHRPLIMGRRWVTPIGARNYQPPFTINVTP